MNKLIVLLVFILVFVKVSFSQLTLTVSNDTTICLGTSALLTATLSDTIINTTTAYTIQTGLPLNNSFSYGGTNANINIDDEVYGPYPLGFNFCFFDSTYSQVYIGSNGWIGFSGAPGTGGTGYDPWPNTPVPNATTSAPHNCVMGPWKDWYPTVGSSPGNYIFYQTVGAAPNRKFVVSYNNIPMFSCTTLYSKFQIVLYETTNIIEDNLVNITVCPGWNSGNGTQAIQNAAGTVAYPVTGRNGTNWTAQNETDRWIPSGPPAVSNIAWYANGTQVGTGTTLLISNTTTPGTTTYAAKVSVCSTIISDSLDLTIQPCGVLSITGTNVNCFGYSTGTATVTISNGIAPYTYIWSNGYTVTNSLDSVCTAPNLAAGIYMVTVSTLNGAYDLYESIQITQRPQLFLQSSSLPETCPGASDGSATLLVTNGVSPYIYYISTQPPSQPQSATNYTFTGLAAGGYSLTVTDTYGCLVTGMVAVSQLSLSFNTNNNSLSCYGDQTGFASITVTGGTLPYVYQWSNGANSQGVTNLGAGTYSVVVTDAHGCQVSSSYVFDQPDPVLIYTSEDQTICLGQSANIVSAVMGGTPPYTYFWNPGGFQLGDITVNPTQDIEYCVHVTDGNHCISNDRCVSVFVNPALSIKAAACVGDTVVISATMSGGNGGPYFYEIYNGPMIVPPIEVNPNASRKYIIIGSDGCGTPQVQDTVNITVLDAPLINFTADIVSGCQPLNVNFLEETPDQGQTYYWDFHDAGFFNYSILKSPAHVFKDAGTYDITLTVTSPLGCKRTFTQPNMVNVYPQPKSMIQATPEIVSIMEPKITFDNLSEGALLSYWSFGDGDSVIVTNPMPHIYPGLGKYLVSLISESDRGCRDTSYYVIEVVDQETFYFPNAFDPYSPLAENRIFRPTGRLINPDKFSMIIYDRWGERVFETTDYYKGWNGKIRNGSIGKTDVYTWIINYEDMEGNKFQKTGSVTLYY
ncbi:MAG: PKD domain-containing protein [Bacteroidia bacterium]|nr:PKD domain-containing protein [Bacteroidia bacterium]